MRNFLCVGLSILGMATVHALPVGNPAEPMLFSNHVYFENQGCCSPCINWCDFFNLRLGFYGDYVYNRRVEAPTSEAIFKEKRASMSTNAGEFVLNICDRVDLFATVGVTNIYLVENAGSIGKISVYYSPTLSYSGGGRLTLWKSNCFYIGIEGQYFYTRAELNSVSLWNEGESFYYNTASERNETYNEWQGALAASYQFVNCANFVLIPYAAIQFAGVNWVRNRTLDHSQVFSFKQQQVVGWTLGVTALLCNLVDITAEGRWANESAFSLTGQVSF